MMGSQSHSGHPADPPVSKRGPTTNLSEDLKTKIIINARQSIFRLYLYRRAPYTTVINTSCKAVAVACALPATVQLNNFSFSSIIALTKNKTKKYFTLGGSTAILKPSKARTARS